MIFQANTKISIHFQKWTGENVEFKIEIYKSEQSKFPQDIEQFQTIYSYLKIILIKFKHFYWDLGRKHSIEIYFIVL